MSSSNANTSNSNSVNKSFNASKGTNLSRDASLVVGVDVGGTFTDLFILDESTGQASIVKVPSTRGNESQGFMNALGKIPNFQVEMNEVVKDLPSQSAIHRIKTIVHGTTVGTNALLERKVAKTGMITTRGFRDVLEMRRRDRPHTWGLRGEFKPVIPRHLRLEVDERVLADGALHTPLDTEQVRAAATELLANGCEAICIFFINAFANKTNELKALEVVRSVWPNQFVTSAVLVLPEIREFERCSTAALSAVLQPVVGEYLKKLDGSLRVAGFGGELLIVQSNGGVMSLDTASDMPFKTALSGPAAGVIACAEIAKASGYERVITGDMGGTSFDVSLIDENGASLAAQTAIEFGLVIRSPMIQIETIGAGGGSIASVDTSQMLSVGPESAGSNPGPACYSRGNTRPTVTDANVVLGRIASDRPLGGGLLKPLDLSLATKAIKEHIADPLGIDVMSAAEAILKVANSKMAGAIRLVSIEKGYDPRDFAYMPFGGGGALHVCAMMREVGVKNGLIPRYPGVTSALGCVIADMRHDGVQTLNVSLDGLDMNLVTELIDSISKTCHKRLDQSGVKFVQVLEHLSFDMLYVGQTHTLSVSIDTATDAQEKGAANSRRDWKTLNADEIRQSFESTYMKAFGRTLGNIGIKVLNLRFSVVGVRPKFDLSVLAPTSTVMPAELGHQSVFHNGLVHNATRYARLELPVGTTIQGPAILEQSDTTVWLEPGFTALVDKLGNLILTQAVI